MLILVKSMVPLCSRNYVNKPFNNNLGNLLDRGTN